MSNPVDDLKTKLQLDELCMDYTKFDSQKGYESPRDIYHNTLSKVAFIESKRKIIADMIVYKDNVFSLKKAKEANVEDKNKTPNNCSNGSNSKSKLTGSDVKSNSTQANEEEVEELTVHGNKINSLNIKFENYLDLINSWYFSTKDNNPHYYGGNPNPDYVIGNHKGEVSACTCTCTCGARPNCSPENINNNKNGNTSNNKDKVNNNKSCNNSGKKEKHRSNNNISYSNNNLNLREDIQEFTIPVNKDKMIRDIENEENVIESVDESQTTQQVNPLSNLNSTSKKGFRGYKKQKRTRPDLRKRKQSCNINGDPQNKPTPKVTKNTKADKLEDQLSGYKKFRLTSLDLLVNPFRRPKAFEIWSPYELAVFQACIFKYERDYERISDFLPNKTKEQLQEMYGLWQATKYYKAWYSCVIKRTKIILFE